MSHRFLTTIVLASAVASSCANTPSQPTAPTSTATSSSSSPTSTLTGASSSSSPSSTPPTTATSTAPVGRSARRAASTFARAYAQYLDGKLPAAALPDTSANARRQAGPPIPDRARHGPLTVQSATAVTGRPIFIAKLTDRAHSFEVQLTLGRVHERELIVAIVPPDLDSILGPATRPIPQPAGSRPAQHAARRFMTGYLAWLYGHSSAHAISDATPQLLAQLKAHPPNIPPAFANHHGHLLALGLKPAPRGTWTAYVSVNDKQETYELTLHIVNAEQHWLVANVTSPR